MEIQESTELEEANEAALCKCFKVALSRPAFSWYNSLSPNSINLFGKLSNKFSTHFIGSKRSLNMVIQMFDVVLRLNESIQEFLERFNREAVNVPNLTDDI